jgi:biopolymer transport protein ExbD
MEGAASSAPAELADSSSIAGRYHREATDYGSRITDYEFLSLNPEPCLLPKVRRFSDRHALQTLTEINITPLLDLAFVLLIIFIITTPLLENSVNLVVPTSGETTQSADPSQVQVISLDKNEVLKLNEEVVDPVGLETRLLALKAEKADLAVVVRPHKELSIQKFIDVMDILQRVRISRVGVLTRPEEP